MMTSHEYNEWRRRLHAHEAEMACAAPGDDELRSFSILHMRFTRNALGGFGMGVAGIAWVVIAGLVAWVVS